MTLRLRTFTTTGRIAVSSATVFIGNPSIDTVIQNINQTKPHKRRVLNRPQGVALDQNGNFYIANTGGANVLKFDSQANLLATSTAKSGVSSDAFFDPVGIAVSGSGTVYVSDRANSRVVLLDAGGTAQRVLGKTDKHGRPTSGSGPGEFNAPAGLAISSTLLAVADTNNSRLEIFDLTGDFIRVISLPQNRGDGSPQPYAVAFSLPAGQAGTAANIVVTDVGNQRILGFSPTGTLLFTYGNNSIQGLFDQLKGLAASAAAYLYTPALVNFDIQKLDFVPETVGAFNGGLGRVSLTGMAVDSASSLFVTDTHNNQVLKFTVNAPPTHYVGLPLVDDGTLPASSELSGTSGPDSTFQWGQVFVFPNPAKGGVIPTIHAEVGIADRVTIKIYNVAGQELRQDVITAPPALIDSGSGPQYVYEYPWTGHIASGVYFFVVDAERGGQHLTKSGKFAELASLEADQVIGSRPVA
jgi:hypothetical protein